MTNKNDFDDELTAVAPWYVNGTLPNDERREFELLVLNSVTMRAELARLTSFKREIAASIELSSAQFSEERSLTKVLAMVQAHDEGKLSSMKMRTRSVPSWYRTAFAAAATVLVVQSLFLMSDSAFLDTNPTSRLLQLGTAHGGSAGSNALPQLQITFKAKAQEADIRRTLSGVGAEIVGGPGALGVYTVSVPVEDFVATTKFLSEQKSVVERVSILRLPATATGK